MKQITELPAWKALVEETRRRDWKPAPGNQSFQRSISGITFDFSRQQLTEKTINLLIQLAQESALKEKIEDLFSGKKINNSEQRAALHTALRHFSTEPVYYDSLDIMGEIRNTREKIKQISESVRNKSWRGLHGDPIEAVVNVGIGGSDLGPRLCINAFPEDTVKDIRFYFISDVDPDSFNRVIQAINPRTTLFIISSKSFTTKETLLNASKAMALYTEPEAMDHHFIAITAYPDKALACGFKHILPLWDFVGGRFSLCSAINLITAVALGYEKFLDILAGANSADLHFRQTAFEDNIPVLMGLLGIWNNNFLNIHNLLLLTYSKSLDYFVPYIQQLDMESNGKSVDREGQRITYATGPLVWGGPGNQAQHSYLQLLFQGTHQCAADFISLKSHDDKLLNAFCAHKMKVLSEGVVSENNPYAHIPGNLPLNHLSLMDCTPYTLGALIALYEHKVFVMSVIWNINPFDQPGVESAKSVPFVEAY